MVKPARIPVDNFPKLPLEAAKTIAAALANRSSVIVENFGIPIAYGDLSRLEDREWLNDEVGSRELACDLNPLKRHAHPGDELLW